MAVGIQATGRGGIFHSDWPDSSFSIQRRVTIISTSQSIEFDCSFIFRVSRGGYWRAGASPSDEGGKRFTFSPLDGAGGAGLSACRRLIGVSFFGFVSRN